MFMAEINIVRAKANKAYWSAFQGKTINWKKIQKAKKLFSKIQKMEKEFQETMLQDQIDKRRV